MQKNIILTGVGGQGTVLASKLIAAASLAKGYEVMSAETIGMAQKGGSVYDSNGHMRYALGVAGLFRRVQSEDFQNAIGQLVHQARQLSIALGWRG